MADCWNRRWAETELLRRWLKWVALWLGLLLCVYALWRARDVAGDAIGRMDVTAWVAVALLLTAGWWLAVMAWRRYVQAYAGHALSWRVAMRQQGLLLVGKYVPGGVFGFLARLYDAPAAPRERLFWAGLAEQATGVAMPVAFGGVLYWAAWQESLAWLGLVFPLPLLAVVGIWLLHRFAAKLPWLKNHAGVSLAPAWRHIGVAVILQCTHLVAWMVLIAVLAHLIFGLSGYTLLGIAAAFCLAVAAGMLVVFAPGGIGVREVVLVGLTSPWLDTTQAIFLSALLRMLSSAVDAAAGLVAVACGRRKSEARSQS